jgi:acetyl-CoA C-acetyltransferase
VEIAYQLGGQAGRERQLERAEVGLAQSIRGLGNNNLVTILERTDRKRVVKEGWGPGYHPEIGVSKKSTASPPSEGIGTLETFTILYTTPEGFVSPLTLGFVRAKDGQSVMACNPDYSSPKELKIGQKVYLRIREGIYVFEKLTLWNRLKHRFKKQPKNN